MQLTDSHCHIHSADYPIPIDEVDAHCREAGVTRLICVGEDAADSQRAVDFVADRPNSWAAVGQHPHEAKYGVEPLRKIRDLVQSDRRRSAPYALPPSRSGTSDTSPTISKPGGEGASAPKTRAGGVVSEGAGRSGPGVLQAESSDAFSAPFSPSPARASGATAPDAPGFDIVEGGEGAERRQPRIVAIGECGLDYFYGHSSKQDQQKALRYQIELALEYDLPLIFHVRDAFDDFWPIFDSYNGVRGVLHSFTDNIANLNKAISRGLYIGVNGIMTFTKNDRQLEVAKAIPLNNLLLETDAPFLTPTPMRGKVNEPARVLQVAEFLGRLRQMSPGDIAVSTTTNARKLFSI